MNGVALAAIVVAVVFVVLMVAVEVDHRRRRRWRERQLRRVYDEAASEAGDGAERLRRRRTELVSAQRVELVEQTERFTRALLGRLSSGRTLEARAQLLKAGVQAVRNLVELRELGYDISQATIDTALDQLDEACGLMIDLMPHDERR